MDSEDYNLDKDKKYDSAFTLDVLKKYYSMYYPSKLIIDWLTKKDIKNLKNREFCFTLEQNKYVRFQSFKTLKEFQNRIASLNPIKIDIGGIYNQEPRNYIKNKTETEFICEEKELVFDIDINDYNEVRMCCQKNDVCPKCWKYIIAGAKILERILTEDFGFQKIFFVYSGRRGIHCWVCDKRACILNQNGREAIEKYIYYEKAKDNVVDCNKIIKRNFAFPVHPSYLSAVSIIKNDFYNILEEQDLLNDIKYKKLLKNIISLYFEIADIESIDKILKKRKFNSSEKIKNIYEHLRKIEKLLKNNNNINYFISDACLYEFMMYILYPRLDRNVTTQIGHLLKGPFCIHPETGYIAVPMSISLMEKFAFKRKIPKVDYLIEYENNDEKQSFSEFINFFDNFVKNINEYQDE